MASDYETYDRLHDEMKRLSDEADLLPIMSPERQAIVLQINELREKAYLCLPETPMPNKDSYGRFHGKLV